jgi:hypothetical protein
MNRAMKNITSPIALLAAGLAMSNFTAEPTCPVVGTGQNQCCDNSHAIAAPQPGQPFYGQDAQLSDGGYPFFWSGTTHLDGPPGRTGGAAVYVCFGRALGWMQFPPGVGEFRLLDVHGAGAQRSDPKAGHPAAFPHGRGPHGDVIRIYNFVRCVRDCVK